MTIADIKLLEEKRENQLKTVHLIREGDWYRAHDWSTWLLIHFPMCDKQLSVTAKKLKDGYIDAFVGFPCSSMSKYLPNDGSIDFLPVGDTQVDVVLKQVEMGDATAEDIRKQVDGWKDSLPLQESKKQRREDSEVRQEAPRISRISDIIARIVSIPMEDISPKEAYDILRDLRRQVSALF